MEQQVQKMGFGYTDDTSQDLQSKSGGKFGLNQGFLTKFEYNPTAGKDGAAANAIDVTVQVGEREFRSRFYEVNKVFDKDGNEITDVNSPAYIQKYNDEMTQLTACIVHIVKAFRPESDIQAALATPPSTFADWAKIMCSLVVIDVAKTTPIDVFLEYQWTIPDGKDQTYLQMPKNMKGGYWISKLQEGPWTEDRSNGLAYKNASGATHPFSRNTSYMESNKAIQQTTGAGSPSGGSDMGASAAATSATW